ncbi:MAG TPA: hypothetical protein VMZ05_05280 [Spirochaetota bacterium]|nr:hypothetical protein [Spirochaetota bacterium]
MKRVMLLVITLIFICVTGSLFADGDFDLDFKLDMSVSIPSGFFITPSVRAMYNMGTFGAGAELKYSHNLKYNDSYFLGFGLVELGPIYGGLGFAAKLTDAHDPTGEYYFATPETDVTLALTGGALFKPIPLGPGKLGFNAGFDLYASATPVKQTDVSNPADLIGALFTSGIASGFNAIFNLFKINLGVNYTVEF